jgi:hypothetical protein
MRQKQCLADYQAQYRITQKLQPLVVSRAGSFSISAARQLLASRALVGERPVSQRTDQQLRPGKAMPERRFQFGQSCRHAYLDPVN